jgi:hypothetical protein
MSDFTDFDDALSLFFDEFGFEATFLKNTGSTHDTATGENVSTYLEIPVEAILLDLTLQSNGASVKFGTLVQAGDKEFYIRPSEKTDPLRIPLVVIPMKDKVKVNGVEFNIITMKEINTTATEPLLYDLYIRR